MMTVRALQIAKTMIYYGKSYTENFYKKALCGTLDFHRGVCYNKNVIVYGGFTNERVFWVWGISTPCGRVYVVATSRVRHRFNARYGRACGVARIAQQQQGNAHKKQGLDRGGDCHQRF